MPYKPGESGNPKGRPPVGRSLADALRRRFPPDRVVDIAESLTESEDDRVRMIALQFIADRGYGKVVDTSAPDADDDSIDLSHIPIDERRLMLTTVTRMAALSVSAPDGNGVEH